MRIEMKNQHLAQIIREEREKRNLTQEHLAQLAELSARTVQRIENDGTHSKETLMAVAEAFEVDCKELLRMAQERAEKGGKASEDPFLLIQLVRKRSGKALLDAVNGSDAAQPDYPHDLNPRQTEAVGFLLDYINDLAIYGWSDIEPSQRLGFEQELSGKLTELEQLGFGFFAGVYRAKRSVEGGKPFTWQTTVLLVARIDDPRIVRLTNCEEFINGLIPKSQGGRGER